MSLVITYDSEPAGRYPITAEGTINGQRFRFHARGTHWELHIASPGQDPLDERAWHYREAYKWHRHTDPRFNATGGRAGPPNTGSADRAECVIFIERIAHLWLCSSDAT